MATGQIMRDHGGNLDAAMARFGGEREMWLDLSTGINPDPYPLPDLPARAWAELPTARAQQDLTDAARGAFGTPAEILPCHGAQAAIQALPWLREPGRAAILAPTYNEHAAALRMAGWHVEEVATIDALAGADLAVLVNPNNPDGRETPPERLLALAGRVGLLVVDESFVEACPPLSLAPFLPAASRNVILLRSFGKFFGLAGLRLGFVLCDESWAEPMRARLGPWPISGPAIEIARHALADSAWQDATRATLQDAARRLDALASGAGWTLAGGTPLFRTYVTPDATAARDRLAQSGIWTRVFPYSQSWLRLGMPPAHGWEQLTRAFATL